MTEGERQCLDCRTPLTEEYHNALRCRTCSGKRIGILQDRMEDRNRTIDELEGELRISG